MRIARLIAGALLAGLAGCGASEPRTLLTRCLTVGSERPERISIRVPSRGTLRVSIEPRGIAIVAGLAGVGDTQARATSPVDRLGPISLVASVRARENAAVEITSRDSRELRGEVCVLAELLPRFQTTRTRAEREFAAAGSATHAREWQQAYEHYAEAAGLFERLALSQRAGHAHHAMGELAYMRLHRESDAIAAARTAREAFGSDSPLLIGTLLLLEARARGELEDLTAADKRASMKKLVEKARALLRSSNVGERELLRLQVFEGFVAYQSEDRAAASRLFKSAMDECRAARDWECFGTAAQNVAVLAQQRQGFSEALEIYEEARRHLDPRVAPEQAADVLDNLGRLQRVAGLVSASDASHAEALRLYVRLRDCDSVRRTLTRLGALHVQVGSLEDALLELRRAASLDCGELFSALTAIREESREEKPPPCTSMLQPQRLSSDGKFAVLQAALAIHDALLLLDEFETAAACLAQAERYASTSRHELRLANARGELSLERRDTRAQGFFAEARQIADAADLPAADEHRGWTLLGLAKAYVLAGDHRAAERAGMEALRASASRGDVGQAVQALQSLAAAFRAAKEPELALRTLETAVVLSDRIPIDELPADIRASYLSAQYATFAALTDLLVSSAADESGIWRAFFAAERGRARSMRHALRQADAVGVTSDPDSVAVRHRKLLLEVASAFQDVGSYEVPAKLRKLISSARKESSEHALTNPRALQDRLRELDATLVLYSTGVQNFFAFVITSRRIHLVPLGDRANIVRTATSLTNELGRRERVPSSVRQAARELAHHVWWPLTDLVKTRHVLIAPEDALHFVPFAALPWSPGSETELVLHRASTTLVPSALFVTLRHRARGEATARIALIGDPIFRRAAWTSRCDRGNSDQQKLPYPQSSDWTEWMPSLPASRNEVLSIADLARETQPRRQVETYLGCAATAEALKSAARRGDAVLHVATHGRVDARRPRLSALAFSPESAGDFDASFELREILNLELDADLITLSACDTSRGRVLRGEGVVGPAQAFLQAGAASVIASYWRVEDDVTARFMRQLYEHLLTDNMTTADALRAAQLKEQRQGDSISWAAFALHGQADTQI